MGLLFLITCCGVLLMFFWLSSVRLLVFLVLLEFVIFLVSLGISPSFSVGGEVLVLFVTSGGVLSMLLLIVTSSTRKFGIYSSEI